MELSWGDRQIAGAPGHFSFNAFHGSARLAPDDVAYVLYGVLEAASQHLREEIPDGLVFEQLVRDVQRLETSDHRRRLGLISGYHDRSYGAQLALASGPWAPVDVEKRANAFAAMLLMPADLVESIVRKMTLPLDSASAVWQVANAMQTSFSATLEHLANLGFLDDAVRDSLRAEMEARAAAANW